MVLSELMVQLKSKGVKISLKPNYKKFYNSYPHVIRLNDWREGPSRHQESRELRNKIYMALQKINAENYRTRHEFYEMCIYCTDPYEILSAISVSLLKKYVSVDIGLMSVEVVEESNSKVQLPRAQTVVVKKLPYNEYRFRVHWPRNYTFEKIGLDALGAIIDQINNDSRTKKLNDYATQKLKAGRFWGASYFYTNSEDLFSIISLINPLFIKKIEKFTTLEELNEKTTS